MTRWLVLIEAIFWALSPAARADSNTLKARIDLEPASGKVKVEREHKPYRLNSTKLEAVFGDPNDANKIRRILFDPTYVAQKDGSYEDFWIKNVRSNSR